MNMMVEQRARIAALQSEEWDPEAERLLRRLWDSGQTVQSICGEFVYHGKTVDQVLAKIEDMLSPAFSKNRIPSPIDRALYVLGGQAAREGRSPGGFRLRGNPATAIMVIDAANEILARFGAPQIPYPGAAFSRGAV